VFQGGQSGKKKLDCPNQQNKSKMINENRLEM
jgi:hypothetical protein